MPEVVVKYKKTKTLKILKQLAEYLDFEVSDPKNKAFKIKGITITPGEGVINNSEMEAIFSDRNLDAAELRRKAWQRTK
ncbi:hypothetical protein [Mucilaginibacter celer]|uniref:Uncharacterized protein n=1 Tax=Mucilaginibacter celer TaxID=2305508 RepID=A0A494W0F0_9SPHI|nr:hypothetical protein [Mucilaginibacter celer]AYL97223.1 hypothetical protein HYN43_018755 [Mucilaginibacter celer]